MTTESMAASQRDIAKETHQRYSWEPMGTADMWHRRNDRNLQLSICLHVIYAGHEIEAFTGVPYAKIAAIFRLSFCLRPGPCPWLGTSSSKFGIRKLMAFGAVLYRARMGAGWDRCSLARGAVSLLRCHCRNRRRNHLHFVRCQCGEVVSGQAGTGGWVDGRRVRWRRRPHGHSYRQFDPHHGMGQGDGCLGAWAGHYCIDRCHDPPPSAGRLGARRMGSGQKIRKRRSHSPG